MNFFGRLVFAQAQEGSMANDAFVGPVSEFDLSHQLRTNPVNAAHSATVGEGS